jgi:hypothetical protein
MAPLRDLPLDWQVLVASVNGRVLFGMAGVRDPESPCEEFDPVDDIDWLGLQLTAAGDGDCQSDGHYLCLGCTHLDFERSSRCAP